MSERFVRCEAYRCGKAPLWMYQHPEVGPQNLEGEVPFLTYTTRVSIGRTSQVSTPRPAAIDEVLG